MLGWFILDTQSASRHLFIEAFLIGRSPHCERFLFATFVFFALDSSKLKKKTKTFGYRNFIHVDHIEPDMLLTNLQNVTPPKRNCRSPRTVEFLTMYLESISQLRHKQGNRKRVTTKCESICGKHWAHAWFTRVY